jgi:hypothetical protein
MDEAKFPQWFKLAKDIVEKNPDIAVCLSDEEFFHFINAQVPIAVKLSKSYIIQILYFDDKTKSTISDRMMEQYGYMFREWWMLQRTNQQLKLYSRLKTNDKNHQRELEILARRYHANWGNKDRLKIDANVNAVVTMNLCDKLRKISKDKV